SDGTFTDHLGVAREVHTRNDITVNRAMFILGGYIFDQRARYSFTVWTSAGAASIIVASNIGWPFNTTAVRPLRAGLSNSVISFSMGSICASLMKLMPTSSCSHNGKGTRSNT